MTSFYPYIAVHPPYAKEVLLENCIVNTIYKHIALKLITHKKTEDSQKEGCTVDKYYISIQIVNETA